MLCSHDPIPLLKWSVGVPASEIGHRQRITDSGIASPPPRLSVSQSVSTDAVLILPDKLEAYLVVSIFGA